MSGACLHEQKMIFGARPYCITWFVGDNTIGVRKIKITAKTPSHWKGCGCPRDGGEGFRRYSGRS